MASDQESRDRSTVAGCTGARDSKGGLRAELKRFQKALNKLQNQANLLNDAGRVREELHAEGLMLLRYLADTAEEALSTSTRLTIWRSGDGDRE